LYGAARIGDFVVISNYRPSSSGWAIILLSVTERAAQPGVFNSTYGSDASPTAPKGGKKKFVLDPLLD
jgi:hypothetical protein